MSDEKKPPVQYILVRKDLPVFVQMVQACHASSEAVRVAPVSHETHIRLLHVENEAELLAYAEELTRKGHDFRLVCEPDEPFFGQATALATDPASPRIGALGKIFWHLSKAS